MREVSGGDTGERGTARAAEVVTVALVILVVLLGLALLAIGVSGLRQMNRGLQSLREPHRTWGMTEDARHKDEVGNG